MSAPLDPFDITPREFPPGSDTRSALSPSPSPGSPSLRSGLAVISADLGGAAVAIYIASLVAPLLKATDSRWMWGLGALVLIAAPTSATQLLKLARTALTRR